MTISAVLVPNGTGVTQHHALAQGSITAGAGNGEVAGVGANQLMTLVLPFPSYLVRQSSFVDQIYILSKSMDGNVSDIRLDAVPVTIFPNNTLAVATLRLRLDVTALPASVSIWIESHHSAGV
jgi:hypothetical protein